MLTTALLLAGCGSGTPDDGAAPSDGGVGTPGACASDAGLDAVPDLHPSVDGYPVARVALIAPDGSCRIELAVRHADDPNRRAHGLMEVPELPPGTGMLFTYPDRPGDRQGGYWMKNTLVPLSIAYVDAEGTIADIVAMQPCESDPCPSYPPSDPYRSTLEVPQGWFDRVGVTEGWRLELVTG